MIRTLDDLRTTLLEYGAEPPVSTPRTVSLHGRIRRMRRQRVAAGVAIVAVVASISAVGVRALTSTTDTPASGHVPTYAYGGQLAAAISLDSTHTLSATADVVATSATLILVNQCTSRESSKVTVAVLVNGKWSAEVCGGSATQGVTVGQRLHIEFRLAYLGAGEPSYVTRAQATQLPKVTSHGGVYFAVPRSQYVFPPRPERTTPLAALVYPGIAINGRTDKSQSVTANVGFGLDLHLAVSAPGVISVQLDGKEVSRWSTWDYVAAQDEITQTPAELKRLGITANTAALTVSFQDFPTPPVQWSAVLSR